MKYKNGGKYNQKVLAKPCDILSISYLYGRPGQQMIGTLDHSENVNVAMRFQKTIVSKRFIFKVDTVVH